MKKTKLTRGDEARAEKREKMVEKKKRTIELNSILLERIECTANPKDAAEAEPLSQPSSETSQK